MRVDVKDYTYYTCNGQCIGVPSRKFQAFEGFPSILNTRQSRETNCLQGRVHQAKQCWCYSSN